MFGSSNKTQNGIRISGVFLAMAKAENTVRIRDVLRFVFADCQYQCTVKLKVVDCVTLPDVPVTVTV